MDSYLTAEPLLLCATKDTEELYIERHIVLNSVLERVEEEIGKRPEYIETDKKLSFKGKADICSNIDFLKRYACYLTIQGRPPFIEGAEEPNDALKVIELYKDEYAKGYDTPFRHLIIPEYPTTYYLPLDFHMPVVITEDNYLHMLRESYSDYTYDVTKHRPEIIIASSIRLLSDLNEIDEFLNALRDNDLNQESHFYHEKQVLRELYRLANLAIDNKMAILWSEKSLCV
jgi:hypothetical protein